MARRSAAPLQPSPPQVTRVWAALGAIYLIWGSTYLAIRLMVETVPPALGAGVRFVIAGGAMLSFLIVRRGAFPRVSRRELAWAGVVGTLLAAGGNGLVTVAEQDVPSGLAALLIATEPLIIVLLRWVTGDRADRATLAGVALGFVGVGVLMLPGGRPDDVPLGMTLLVIVASACWATGSFISPRVGLPRDPLVSTGWSLLIGGGVLTICGLAGGEASDFALSELSLKSVAAFAYLVIVGSIVAFSCYSWLLANAPISQVSTYAYVNPVIAVALGAVFLSEDVAGATLAGMALIIASVVVIVRREAAPAATEDDAGEVARSELSDETDFDTVSVSSRN